MPHKNTIRKYFPGGYYHIYNRGVEKRIIFNDKQDYFNFLSILESYMTPKKLIGEEILIRNTPYWRSKLDKDEVEIISYCLMPNHYHFILKQNTKDGITKFMRRISASYVGYFNKKYERVGTLFQGKFKTALIENDTYLLHLSRYIHLNPLEILEDRPLDEYGYSSYPEYLNRRTTKWIHPQVVLNFFKKSTSENIPIFKKINSYQSFVEKYIPKVKTLSEDLILE